MNQVELFEVGDTRYRLEPEDDDGGWVLSFWIAHENRTHYWRKEAHLIEEGGYWKASAHGPYQFCKMSAR